MNKKSKIAILCFWGGAILLQFIHVFVTGDTIEPDEYKGVILNHILSGDFFYPNWNDLANESIIAPGWMNLGIWLMRFWPDNHILYLFNIFAANAIVFFIFQLLRKNVGEKVAWYSILVFALYPTWIIAVNRGNSEIPFMFFFFLSVYLLSLKNTWFLLGAGLALGFANWCRPFLPIMLITGILLVWLFHRNLTKIIPFIGGCAIFIVIVGGVTYQRLGRFEYQSTMQGFNMLLGAHDEADGSFNMEGDAFVIDNYEDLPYYETDRIYKERAISWIKNNPIKWLSLMPRKFFLMFFSDTHATIAQDKGCQLNTLIHTRSNLSFWQWVTWINLAAYYLIMLASLIGLFFSVKRRNWFMLIWILYLAMSIAATMLTVSINRYHFVMMPVFIMLAVYGVSELYKIKASKEKTKL